MFVNALIDILTRLLRKLERRKYFRVNTQGKRGVMTKEELIKYAEEKMASYNTDELINEALSGKRKKGIHYITPEESDKMENELRNYNFMV